ncbi:hypothetical protein XELAEV_18013072mg [Xenopus laevis]|uniref:Uncharacterized protein n=1 Tax=Xenopus laevis TaxID=8355 RepID=A0A974DNP9_XENLA|nr:hypothetical protein XELAEV_18013072mg [Xenopus laevis]
MCLSLFLKLQCGWLWLKKKSFHDIWAGIVNLIFLGVCWIISSLAAKMTLGYNNNYLKLILPQTRISSIYYCFSYISYSEYI